MRNLKCSLFVLAFLTIALMGFPQSITITNPNGAENWELDSTHNITWSSSGISGNIIIKLMKGGTMLGSIAWNIPNTGTYSWTINTVAGTEIVPGSDYKILVRSFDDHSIQDQSNSNFFITDTDSEDSSINITFPNSSSHFCKGSSYDIEWVKTGSIHANVKIGLYNSMGTSKILDIVNNTANSGSYN